MLVSPGNDFFLALQKPVERTAGAHQLQHECSEYKGWGRRTSLKKKKHFSLEVWCLFESLLPPCVIYECNLKYHFVFVRPHCYDPWSNATFDFRPPDQTQTKIKTECVKLYTHTTCHFCPQAFIDHFSSFRLSKQLILKKNISRLSCRAKLGHFSTVAWRSEGSFGCFECISSPKVVCSRAYVWIWGLFEGRCSSWLHPFNKLPPGNWPLF